MTAPLKEVLGRGFLYPSLVVVFHSMRHQSCLSTFRKERVKGATAHTIGAIAVFTINQLQPMLRFKHFGLVSRRITDVVVPFVGYNASAIRKHRSKKNGALPSGSGVILSLQSRLPVNLTDNEVRKVMAGFIQSGRKGPTFASA